MRLVPVVVDARPAFLAGTPALSLLQLPLGAGSVFEHVAADLAPHVSEPPIVVSSFEAVPGYVEGLKALGLRFQGPFSPAELQDFAGGLEPSDFLLLRDSRRASVAPLGLLELLDEHHAQRRASHLLAPALTAAGTSERVLVDTHGQVARIQRFYEGVTWPFASAVACSLVPVAALVGLKQAPLAVLADLRAALSTAGVPARDVFPAHQVFDLEREGELLDLSERLLLEAAHGGAELAPAPSARVHPTASLRGLVAVGPDVEIGEGVLVIGPAALGRGARLGAEAVLVQSVVAPGTSLPERTVVRQHVVTGTTFHGGRLVVEPPLMGPGAAAPALRRIEQERHEPAWVWLKRPVEFFLAGLALLLLSPLLGLVALLVKLDSRGPVLFGHEREGLGGRVFRCWKFRTMHQGAEARQRELQQQSQVDGPQFKMDHDPRVTRLGLRLRRLNVDELPQLLNVFKGEMSFVGPRPSPFRENQVCVPWREARLSVEPGITGLWQICRNERSAADFHQWIYYDLLYVHHRSLALDLKILVATVVSLAGRYPVPLSRLLPPETFHERRRRRRVEEPQAL